MAKILQVEIINIEKLTPIIFRMTMKSEYIAKNALPGQFVNVKCSEGLNALLRRPISICSVDRSCNTFDIVFQIKGIGTEYLSQKKVGSKVDLIGPLGKAFDLSPEYRRIAVIGGGIGIFPLFNILREIKNAESSAFIGFRNSDYAVLVDEFRKNCSRFNVSSDDGSVGYKGLVVDMLEKDLQENKYDIIYTCGPTPMIKRVVEIAGSKGIRCQVSLEQRMGCGIGACLVCACKTKYGDEWEYSHVCKDGPVFWSNEVVFDD